MTNDQERRVEKAVENVWFKGAARAVMLFGVPVFAWLGSRTYDALDHMQKDVATLRSQVAVLEVIIADDRKATVTLYDNTNDRINILSHRIDDGRYTSGDATRDLALRDQSITRLDRRVDTLEGRVFNYSPGVTK